MAADNQFCFGLTVDTRESVKSRSQRAPSEPIFGVQFDLFVERPKRAPLMSHREQVRARARELHAEGKTYSEILKTLLMERLNRGARWSVTHARAFALSSPAPMPRPVKPRRVLTDAEVCEIRRIKHRMSRKEICRRFGITRQYCAYIVMYHRRANFD